MNIAFIRPHSNFFISQRCCSIRSDIGRIENTNIFPFQHYFRSLNFAHIHHIHRCTTGGFACFQHRTHACAVIVRRRRSSNGIAYRHFTGRNIETAYVDFSCFAKNYAVRVDNVDFAAALNLAINVRCIGTGDDIHIVFVAIENYFFLFRHGKIMPVHHIVLHTARHFGILANNNIIRIFHITIAYRRSRRRSAHRCAISHRHNAEHTRRQCDTDLQGYLLLYIIPTHLQHPIKIALTHLNVTS